MATSYIRRSDQHTDQYSFTVFTATYNRVATLWRVWESLKRQTFRDFEWIIVDDGSTDDTASRVAEWQVNSTFSIKYYYQQHGHKKTAFNRGVREANGLLFLTLDSDDECSANALERFWWHWNNIPADQRCDFSAITALCSYGDGNIVGNRFPGDNYVDSDSIEIVRHWKVKGDKWGFQRTAVLQQIPYPEDVKGHVPEGIVWVQIATRYKTRFINEVLKLVHTDDCGGAPRLTNTNDVSVSAAGYLLLAEASFRYEWKYIHDDPAHFIHSAINFTRFSLHCGGFSLRRAARLHGFLLIMTMTPAGVAAYCRDLWRGRRG